MNTTCLATPTFSTLSREQVIEKLSALRLEWEAVNEGNTLIHITASVGLLLYDLTVQLGMSQGEQAAILGEALYRDVVQVVHDHPSA